MDGALTAFPATLPLTLGFLTNFVALGVGARSSSMVTKTEAQREGKRRQGSRLPGTCPTTRQENSIASVSNIANAFFIGLSS